MKMRVYDEKGRERWLPAGARVPAGWYRDGKPPVLLSEEHVVVEVHDEGNPYEEGYAGKPQRWLEIRSVSEVEAERAAREREQAGFREAARLTEILHSIGGPAHCQVEYSPRAGVWHVAGARTGECWVKIVDEADLRAKLPQIIARVERFAREEREREIQATVKAAGEAAGYAAGKIVKWTGGWVSHEDSFGGLAGGDYESGSEWQWNSWAERAIARILAGEPVDAVCAEEIASARAEDERRAEIAAQLKAAINDGIVSIASWSYQKRQALVITHNRNGNLHDETLAECVNCPDLWSKPELWPQTLSNWPRIAARIARRRAAIARLERIKKRANLRTLKLTRAEIEEALASPEREAELREIAWVRVNWRNIMWAAARGKRGNLRTEAAISLRNKIYAAQERAAALRSERERAAKQAASATATIASAPVKKETNQSTSSKPAVPAAAATKTTFGVGLSDAFAKIGL